jgi:hypothetical protein
VEAGELIAGVLADMRCKCRQCCRIVRLQLCKGFQIAVHRLIFVLLIVDRFEGAQRLGPAAQHEVANRPTMKLLHFLGQGGADADAGAELLIGGLEPRGDVNGVAVSRLVEEPLAAEIGDQCRPGMRADPPDAKRDPLLPTALAEILRPFIQSQGARDGTRGLIGLLVRHAVVHHNNPRQRGAGYAQTRMPIGPYSGYQAVFFADGTWDALSTGRVPVLLCGSQRRLRRSAGFAKSRQAIFTRVSSPSRFL